MSQAVGLFLPISKMCNKLDIGKFPLLELSHQKAIYITGVLIFLFFEM